MGKNELADFLMFLAFDAFPIPTVSGGTSPEV
jgi:hypothetical protein